jgi:hypothetical protein
MAGEWLKLEVCTPEKSEVLAITARMGWDDADLTVGKLFRVWRWFDQQTTDGNAQGVTTALLDRIVGVTGFCAAMQSVGWLHVTEAGVGLPNFDRHNGNTAKNRALTAKRVANHKANAKANALINALSNANTVTDALPREEKKREEVNTKEPTVLVPDPADREPVAAPDRLPSCPTDRLVDLYHKHLPMLPRVEVMNDGRRRTLSARWREVVTDKDIAKSPDPRQAALEFFDWYFEHAAQSAFLTGRAKNWRADFDFLTTPSKFAKVVEGHYHN